MIAFAEELESSKSASSLWGDPGEEAAASVKRELMEEVGCRLTPPLNFMGVFLLIRDG
jgi:8-oxo-dGTP pyrophosphatase MutT (NUDIX family)